MRALTDREEQVLFGLAEGLTTAEIASELHLSPETVKGYVGLVIEKFQARNRVHAIALAYHHGVLVARATA